MLAWLANPGWLLIAAGLALPAMPLRLRQAILVAAPVAAIGWLLTMPRPVSVDAAFLGYTLTPLRLDGLAFVFALIFLVANLLAGLYMLHVRNRLEPASSLVYAGAAVAAVLAGDLVTLFVYWEATAIASALIILANGPRTYRVTLRYLLIQVTSGLLLMAGAIIHIQATGSAGFNALGLATPGGLLIFLAFGIKAAFPLLHNWLPDAYPSASASGTVVLSAFTTKLAIYTLARGYAGTELLIPIGSVMVVFPMLYAIIEDELRRVLAYSLNIQLGFMVVGIGIGTELALNGTAAHAVTHILYKALLFMSMGAVLLRTGSVRASSLGGLYRSMPVTTVCCIIGAASIAAFPLFAGFVSKSLILGAAAHEGATATWLTLMFASAGALVYVGIKVPYFTFFGRDAGIRCREAPPNMLVAMGLTATACIGLGCAPGVLYGLLPYAVDYAPYTTGHILSQMQLLLFSALAFTVLLYCGLYPPALPATNLDFDWTYRRLAPTLIAASNNAATSMRSMLLGIARPVAKRSLAVVRQLYAPHGMLAGTWGTGLMALWVAILLAAYLLLYFG